ncbi:hypothetical protein RHGRI_002654 [Rhododendron griersonianum]|uniref:UDP-glycosyltransferases domain-containing protein n=1 Tax=Rhododendron griersonianum TaxID=479676 RepID=A0AAV6LRZ3_9ERIC|nr:hypothetical protein RHGRI_002654 [Rhododendron griersonianum]
MSTPGLFISSNTQPSASSLISTATISDGHDGCGFTVAGDPGSYLARFRSVGSDTLSDLIKKLDEQGPRVDGLVYDPFLPWALDVAREFGLVGAAFFTQSCAVSNVYYHVRKGILKLPFEEGKAILVPGLPPLERSEKPSFVEQFEEIAWGLEETNYSFLWVVRDSERSKLPEKLVDLARAEKGLLVTWSPQLKVLAHESVGCFVTHCGFNSILETLSLGVPVVAVPQWTDQRTNAKYVEEVWGVGVRGREG